MPPTPIHTTTSNPTHTQVACGLYHMLCFSGSVHKLVTVFQAGQDPPPHPQKNLSLSLCLCLFTLLDKTKNGTMQHAQRCRATEETPERQLTVARGRKRGRANREMEGKHQRACQKYLLYHFASAFLLAHPACATKSSLLLSACS